MESYITTGRSCFYDFSTLCGMTGSGDLFVTAFLVIHHNNKNELGIYFAKLRYLQENTDLYTYKNKTKLSKYKEFFYHYLDQFIYLIGVDDGGR